MAKDYLAMYLNLELDLGVSHTIPIMLFDESPSRVGLSFQTGAVFKTIQEVKDAVHRIGAASPFQCTVLHLPLGSPAMSVLFKRPEAQEQLKLMLDGLNDFFNPPSAPVLSSQHNTTAHVQICIGIKNKHTVYPQSGFIDWPLNFKRDRFVFQFQDAEIVPGAFNFKGLPCLMLTFIHATPSQIFFMSMD